MLHTLDETLIQKVSSNVYLIECNFFVRFYKTKKQQNS